MARGRGTGPGRRAALAGLSGCFGAALAATALAGIPRTEGVDDALLPERARRALESAGGLLARGGRADELARLVEVLAGLGADPRSLERWERRWERRLERPEPEAWERSEALAELRLAVRHLGGRLDELEAERAAELARWIVALDDQHPAASRLLGHTEHDGRWMRPEEAWIERGRARLRALHAWADGLAFPVEVGPSEPVLVRELGLGSLARVEARDVAVHSTLPPERARRILEETLRAAAVSYAVVTGRRDVPPLRRAHFVLLDRTTFRRALEEAAAHGGVPREELSLLAEHSSFQDRRGWHTAEWRGEATSQALILFELARGWLGWDAQPSLLAGHVNWLCLERFGTLLPHLSWRSRGEEAVATRTRSVRRSARTDGVWWSTSARTLYGSRRWMRSLVEAGADPPWSRTLVDAVGKIQDEELMKATLVAEYLMELGEFTELLRATRGRNGRVAAFEEALGQELPLFEGEWRTWLLGPRRGLVQRLEAERLEEDPVVRKLLRGLEDVRARAFAGVPGARAEALVLDEELSAGAELHATYLARNRDQLSSWPGAHEQYPDRPGFRAAGAWAADRSVIHVGAPERAVESWMATFYHRVPLLDPGLLGVGVGCAEEILVADVHSLVAPTHGEVWVVWPPDGTEDVPLAMYPEIPDPVPGADGERLGLPVTLHVHGSPPSSGEIELELRRGDALGPLVECRVSTPSAPTNPRLAPPGVFALLPRAPLATDETYTVTASREDPPRRLRWSFRTR